jgi:hypothetical protein
LLQLPESGDDGEFVEAGMVVGRMQPRRQARGRRSAMEALVRMERWYAGGRGGATGIDAALSHPCRD